MKHNSLFVGAALGIVVLSGLFSSYAQERNSVAPAHRYYIDYEAGDDNNPGTKELPFKHHPWDPKAEGNAKQVKGPNTYYFKRGVTYRGTLVAKESGQPGNPIVLTVDQNWGKGEARVYGSTLITGGWQLLSPEDLNMFQDVPEHSKIWFTQLDGTYIPCAVFQVKGDEVIPLTLARTPNWKVTELEDPRSEWWEFTDVVKADEYVLTVESVEGFELGDRLEGVDSAIVIEKDGRRNQLRIAVVSPKERGKDVIGQSVRSGKAEAKVKSKVAPKESTWFIDSKHLADRDWRYLKNSVIWRESWGSSTRPRAFVVTEYNPVLKGIRCHSDDGWEDGAFARYYLENNPAYLDAPGEFYYDQQIARLYVRLPGDQDPNQAKIEVAREDQFLSATSRTHITIDGLTIRFYNGVDPLAKFVTGAYHRIGKGETRFRFNAIMLTDCSHITVRNCTIEFVDYGVYAIPGKGTTITDIQVGTKSSSATSSLSLTAIRSSRTSTTKSPTNTAV